MPLVILDCDGVLVDSEPITTSLLAEMVTGLGWPMSPEEAVERFKGRDLHRIRDEVESRTGRALGERFITEYRAQMARRFREEGVPPVAGAPQLLDRLDASGTPHAVASNGTHAKMLLTLGGIDAHRWPEGWYGRFEKRRFSAYDIERWKPDPGLFLHAAEAMGVPPAEAVVVEDSPSGVEAARAAGMRAIGLANMTGPDALARAGATAVCETLPEAEAMLRRWFG